MLDHLEAHLLEIKKLLQKNSLHGVLESPEFKVVSLTDLVLTTAQLTKQKTNTNPASGTIPERLAGGTSASDRDDDLEA